MTQLSMRKFRLNHMMYAKLTKLLYERGGTCQELADEVGLRPETVRDAIREMRRQKLVYICAYALDLAGRRSTPTYAFGPGVPDVEKAPALTPRERTANYRARRLQRDLDNLLTMRGTP